MKILIILVVIVLILSIWCIYKLLEINKNIDELLKK